MNCLNGYFNTQISIIGNEKVFKLTKKVIKNVIEFH